MTNHSSPFTTAVIYLFPLSGGSSQFIMSCVVPVCNIVSLLWVEEYWLMVYIHLTSRNHIPLRRRWRWLISVCAFVRWYVSKAASTSDILVRCIAVDVTNLLWRRAYQCALINQCLFLFCTLHICWLQRHTHSSCMEVALTVFIRPSPGLIFIHDEYTFFVCIICCLFLMRLKSGEIENKSWTLSAHSVLAPYCEKKNACSQASREKWATILWKHSSW